MQQEGTEVDSHYSDFNKGVLEEMEENQSFIQFVENYERAYTDSEEHNEPGRCVDNSHLFMGVVKPHH